MATRKSDRRTASRRLEYIYIEEVTPELDGGRFPVKRIVGDAVVVGATILKEGHDHLGARALCRAPGANDWQVVRELRDHHRFRAVLAGRPARGRMRLALRRWLRPRRRSTY